MRRLFVLIATAVLCLAIISLNDYAKQPSPSNAVETAATAAAPPPRRPAAFGINLFTAAYWSNERAFMNLAAAGSWRSINERWSDFDPRRIDRGGNIISLLPGEAAALALVKPPRAYQGNVAIRCTYRGSGSVGGVGMSGLSSSPGRLDFIWQRDNLTSHFRINATDPADPIRDIDCREADADRRALFDPAFVATLHKFKAVRFMDWQQANANVTGDWSLRTLPSSVLQSGPQGVALEHMVALANEAGVDPWFVLPWNGDAAYIGNFAHYVHDHLDPKRTAYIEVGNEIWNRDFPAARQALAEGMKLKLGRTEDEARMRRYAQRAVEVFKIWEKVYADAPDRMVRILSGQNAWPDLIQPALDFADTAQHIDALSSALYFGQDLLSDPAVDTSDLATLFSKLNESMESSFGSARRFKQMADGRGLRFLAYEGGQHVSYRGPDRTLPARLNKDPRMGEAFRIFMAKWEREFGDLLVIYHLTSPIGRSASFGLREYSGQPLTEAPKLKAVLDAIAAAKR